MAGVDELAVAVVRCRCNCEQGLACQPAEVHLPSDQVERVQGGSAVSQGYCVSAAVSADQVAAAAGPLERHLGLLQEVALADQVA